MLRQQWKADPTSPDRPEDAEAPKSDEWTIVSGGFSIETLDLERYRLDGPVIVINRAFYRFPEEADIWAGFDHPTEMYETMPDPAAERAVNVEATGDLLREHRPTIWCWHIHAKYWESVEPSVAIHPWHFYPRGGPQPELAKVPWQGRSSADWSQGSMMLALGLLMRQMPKRVRILGCDQGGVGGWMSVGPRAANWPGRHRTPAYQGQEWWQRRWARERKALEQAISEGEREGITIERVDHEEAAGVSA